jgi:hypothetical protein
MGQQHDHYRAQSERCSAAADRSRNSAQKASWLRLAMDWLALIPLSERTEADRSNVARLKVIP